MRYGPALVLGLCGAAVLRISLFSALYLRYVREGLRPWLVVSGVLLVALAAAAAVTAARARSRDGDGPGTAGDPPADGHADGPGGAPTAHGARAAGGHEHPHGSGPRAAWLLTLPALALLLFPPPALGSYSADRQSVEHADAGVGTFPALPAGDPVVLTLGQFTSRAMYDKARTLTGRTVRMTGFVTEDDGHWYLTRLQVTCCAADAQTFKVEIRGLTAPAADAWVTVTGTWHPEGGLGSAAAWPPALDGTSAKPVRQPKDPYEKRR